MIEPFINLFIRLLGFFKLAIFIYIIMQWLLQFQVINYTNKLVQAVYDTLHSVIEPALAPLRRLRFLKTGQLDLSPIVLVLLVILAQELLFNLKAYV